MNILINKYNIFDFATSELSHSAFFSWLIKQIDPKSYYSLEVREKGLELVNECLKTHKIKPINGLGDIDSAIVERELSHIDITAFIYTKSGRKIGIIIENKVGAQESRKNQLTDYFKEGTKLIEEHFKKAESEKIFIYLKSDYDFDDPLTRFDSNGNVVTTNFKKIDWREIYKIFEKSKSSEDSILQSYACWIKKKYDSIENKLNVSHLLLPNEGIKLLKNDHIGQVHLIKEIFAKLFGDKKPFCGKKDESGYHRWYYLSDLYLKLGTDKGSPWSELWFSEESNGLNYFYRLQPNVPEPLLHARLGCWVSENPIAEKQGLYNKYINLIYKHGLSNLKSKFKFNPNNNESTLSAFNLIGASIEELRRIEELHLDFLSSVRE